MTTPAEALVIFMPSGRRGRVPAGTTVLDAARSLGVDLDAICGGHGLCGRCQVEQGLGDFPKHGIDSRPENLSPAAVMELDYRRRRGMAATRRLGCVARLHGDAVIDVPSESQVHRQVVRKSVPVRDFEIDPVVRLHYVEVERPELASPSGDMGRLLAALEREWALTGLDVDLEVIRGLQPALDAGDWKVTVAVHDEDTVTAIWSGFHETAYGVAIDVGSTTLAAHLANLADGAVLASAGVMNPQIRFGEDLMSRVSYAMLHQDGARDMTRAVRAALSSLIGGLAKQAGIRTEEILELAVVGNPIMHHLLVGIDPTPLGSAPFALATDAALRVRAAELKLPAHPGARLYILPCIAGHVGADTAGVLLAEVPHRDARAVRLVVDVGTNAEIVLGNRDRLLAASSPTGPAFEGAQISSGQRAAPGAIERIRIDPETLEPRYKVIGADEWSDDPVFAAATAQTGVTGICGSGIVEAVAQLYLAGVVTADGIVDGSLSGRTARIVRDGRTFSYLVNDGPPRIAITQNDVRAVQLAKAALYAGARLLMDRFGVDTVDEIRLAGAFGSQIDVTHAMVLGLIPDCDLERVGSAGNAAGTGALIALLSGAARRDIEALVRHVEKVETAMEPRFQEHFVAAMAFPHRSAASPNLERAVRLPPRPSSGQSSDRIDRRRRRIAAAASRGREVR